MYTYGERAITGKGKNKHFTRMLQLIDLKVLSQEIIIPIQMKK